MLILFTPHFVHGTVLREDIGELKIHDLLLRPNFGLHEGREGNFSIGESSFALRWELEQKFAGIIRIGPRTLINPTARYTPKVNDDVTLVEAFAEYNDVYGRFRMGRMPVEFGLEGRMWERNLIFPRSLLFQKRAMMLRDVGISYDVTQGDWYTGFVVHNGESDNDVDGRSWYTARWGYKGETFEIGAAGQTGSTRPTSTALSGDTLANVDPTVNEKWRLGGLYTNISVKKIDWVLECYMGELEQETKVTKYATGHTDLSYIFSKRFSTHVRYDFFDPNIRLYGDQERQISLALMLSNQSHSSNLILVGTKALGEGVAIHNDEIRLIWSLSPSGVVRF
ncbi:MAG: hypothetical protein ACXVA9_12680 [Bdellovibrionales bacterium]